MKKGQIEMMGLVIVVILIVIGGLFYVRFALLGGTVEVADNSEVQVAQATNLLIALANLRMDCGDLREQVSEVLVRCSQEGEYCGQNACDYLSQELPPILDDLPFKDYAFWVVSRDESFFSLGDCAVGIGSGSYTLYAQNERLHANFRICS